MIYEVLVPINQNVSIRINTDLRTLNHYISKNMTFLSRNPLNINIIPYFCQLVDFTFIHNKAY
ncbi:hypothetical protein AsAng_0025570 [Aureispira anguillae]|uniref:Uncharacterized protein n=1 Tax=Aureispira anguillae TaxID=2864201 RepID=A0A915YEV4_9BACT|nr:hypothetical protein AsAng_0025570 [Aureispira anguillae]